MRKRKMLEGFFSSEMRVKLDFIEDVGPQECFQCFQLQSSVCGASTKFAGIQFVGCFIVYLGLFTRVPFDCGDGFL